MNREAFYNTLRPHLGITQEFVFGTEKILDYLEAHPMNVNIGAYALATTYWETGKSMRPVEEGYYLGSRAAAFQRKLRYYPFYGRGLIQTTWKENYEKLALLLGKPKDFFTRDADSRHRLLEWEWAIPALFKATEAGIYTGKSFADYIDDVDESDEEDFKEYKQARRVVNGTDRSAEIAKIALHFEHALRAAGYNDVAPKKSETPIPQPVSGFCLWFRKLLRG